MGCFGFGNTPFRWSWNMGCFGFGNTPFPASPHREVSGHAAAQLVSMSPNQWICSSEAILLLGGIFTCSTHTHTHITNALVLTHLPYFAAGFEKKDLESVLERPRSITAGISYDTAD